jgi:hypothetical protein
MILCLVARGKQCCQTELVKMGNVALGRTKYSQQSNQSKGGPMVLAVG